MKRKYGTTRGQDGERRRRGDRARYLLRSIFPPPCLSVSSFRSFRSLHIFLLLTVVATNACLLKASRPNLPAIFPEEIVRKRTGKPPIIFIPGIIGSELVDRTTGKRMWPELFPKVKDVLALPINSTTLSENRDDIVESRVIESTQLLKFTPEIGVYEALFKALETHGGYRRGDINEPSPDGDRDTYYLFDYDWRRDNVESARKLAGKIEEIKRRTNRPDLRFDIIAHSMGGLIARYFAMYGDADVLGESAPRPEWRGAQSIGRMALFGTPNAGSMDAFRTLIYGYSITEANKPRVNPFKSLGRVTVFTMPSVYQLMPRRASARFYDARLQPIKIDLYDPENWKRYNWSAAFDPEITKRELKNSVKKFGESEGRANAEKIFALRETYLRTVLRRAASFQNALDAASAPPETLRLHLVGGDCEPTAAAALIVNDKGQPRTFFQPRHIPRELRKAAYNKLYLPGDGRVTRQSLFGIAFDLESPEPGIIQLMKYSPSYAIFGCDTHSDLPVNPTLLNNLITWLLGNKQ